MAEITAALVKDLREKTGAGMMDCKKALTETGGDLEGAVDWLRKKGLAKAAKKAGRVAAEGLIGVAIKGTKGAMVEVNSETDFVARNDQFPAHPQRLDGRGHAGPRRHLRPDAEQAPLQRPQELQHHQWPAVVPHQPNPPRPALELAQATADLDPELHHRPLGIPAGVFGEGERHGGSGRVGFQPVLHPFGSWECQQAKPPRLPQVAVCG